MPHAKTSVKSGQVIEGSRVHDTAQDTLDCRPDRRRCRRHDRPDDGRRECLCPLADAQPHDEPQVGATLLESVVDDPDLDGQLHVDWPRPLLPPPQAPPASLRPSDTQATLNAEIANARTTGAGAHLERYELTAGDLRFGGL